MANRASSSRYPSMRGLTRGRITANRALWATMSNFRISVQINRDDEFIENLPDGVRERYIERAGEKDYVGVTMTYGKNSSFGISFTIFTHAELLAFKEIINFAIDKALLSTKARDQAVEEAYDEHDDDSFERFYRSVPEVFVRKGTFEEHGEGLRERLESTDAMVRAAREPRGPGRHRSPMGDGDEADGSTEHDDSEA